MEDYNYAILYYYNWLRKESKSINDSLYLISLYESVLSDMSNYLIGSIAKFDIFLIIVSIVLTIQVFMSIQNLFLFFKLLLIFFY